MTNCLALAGLLLAGAIALPGQTFYGSIAGTVADPSGTPVPGAVVMLVNQATGEQRSASTGPDGAFGFLSLVPGNYQIEISAAGFRRYLRDHLEISVGAAIRVEAGIEPGDAGESPEPHASGQPIGTQGASLSQVLGSRSVQELPLNGRNVLDLASLTPGVVPQGGSEGNLTGKNVLSAGNFQIGGGTANQSASYYDGVPSNTPFGNLLALVPTQDAVAELRVQTNNLSAEYGRYTGGVVILVSRSGSNRLHGSVYEFLRNRALNAGTFFANATGAGKPAFTQNQFGASLGGPLRKNRTFFFASYEGYRQRQAALFLLTVPTPEMRAGGFSDYRNAAGAQIPIYDPLTNCGQPGTAACPDSGPRRQPFAGNTIPASRINPVARRLVDFPVWASPNIPGQPFTHLYNFSRNVSTGGDNDQLNLRGDQSVGAKQRVIARYTRWRSTNVNVDVYGNGLYSGDPYSPERFITDQALLADTYSFSPATTLDIRLGFLRWHFDRLPGSLGIDIPRQFGLPAYYSRLAALDGIDPIATVPQVGAAGYNWVGTGRLAARDNTFMIAPSLIRIAGRHTWKFGGDVRRLDINYFQNNTPGGSFSFDNRFTSGNALLPGATGNSVASLLLGYPAAGTVQTSPFTAGGLRYQGYYANDTWQATSRLTLDLGLRWEIPGVYTERFDRLVTLDPAMINPALAGVAVNGAPAKGAFVLVRTAAHPERGLRPEHWTLFAPRIGTAYRVNDRTVIRAGGGIFYIPADIQFPEGPYGNPVNYLNNLMVSSINSQVTPLNTLSDPYPAGFAAPPGRDPSFQARLLGGSSRTPLRLARYGYTLQWNLAVEHRLPGGVVAEAAWAGLRGVHLPQGSLQMNQIATAYLALAARLRDQVLNPLYGLIANGALSQPTVERGQLLLPFPQYTSTTDPGGYQGNSVYHALQMKAEKRLGSGGRLMAAYTFSKVISDIETLTTGLDSVAGVQDYTNLRGERALSSFDSRQRLTLTYVVDLPAGPGKKILAQTRGFAGKLVSGWGLNGSSTFQEGFPFGLTASPNVTGFNTGLRPNVVTGCAKTIGGAAQSRLSQWFNTACFTVPDPYTFGGESRTDPNLRGHGINNFDAAIFKRTAINERFNLESRIEVFNLFNRVKFGNPNLTASTAANSTFGMVSSQANNPRLIQVALRLRY
jgi:hypothetical protein